MHIKGYVYLKGDYIDNSVALDFLRLSSGKDDFIKRVLQLNGCFSIVAEINGGVMAVSDTTRSFPLFYSKKDGYIFISDEAEELVRLTGHRKINHNGLIDYLHSCCVFFNETLIDEIYQVSAMCYMFYDFETGSIEHNKYKTIYNAEYTVTGKEKMKEYLDVLFKNAAVRLVDSLRGRTAVVALSGGIDSRACLMMLHMMGYRDVICFTYGWKNCAEEEPARKTADRLGYKYIFIPHKRRDWIRTYKDNKSLEYIRYSGNMSSIAHMETHYVLRQLLDEGKIPGDSVVITGHIGLVASSKFKVGSEYKKEEIMEMFWEYWAKLYPYKGKRKDFYNKRFSRYFTSDGPFAYKDAERIFENASFDSVRSKHIINYHRLFEMYGLEWRMPLMDYEFMYGFEKIQPGIRDRKKTVFSEYVLDYTGRNIELAEVGLSFLSKAYRNLRNPVYGIITPWRFFFSGYKNALLPPFPIKQYRFIRRFYSYCALQEIKLIKKWLDEN
jgi:asparagine synthase (glutamine-hydrolysing)